MTDVRQILRRLEFPECAKEALSKIESYIIGRCKQTLVMQLTSEFIFLEDRRSSMIPKYESYWPLTNPNAPMNNLEVFQLIYELIEYFSAPGPEATRNAVFFTLFGSNLTEHRADVLGKLVGTAVTGSVANLLSSAGTWMQQVGCHSPPTLGIAKVVITDFFHFAIKTSERFKQLPLVAPLFAANLMTATAELYMNDTPDGLNPPRNRLLDVFTEWVSDNHTLCYAAHQPLALPSGAIAMPPMTPIAGLLRWTILAPLVSQQPAYGQLHLSLLKTLYEIAEKPGSSTAINAQHLIITAYTLKKYAMEKQLQNDDPNYNSCMLRFAEAVQVGFACKCIFGNIPQLLFTLQELPPHPIMNIVLRFNLTDKKI